MLTAVTGGAGFIGSHIAESLIRVGHTVRVLDNLSTGYRENVPDGAELVVGDITDPEAVETALRGAEVVFHEAAHRAVLRSVERPLETDRTNTHGTLTVLDMAVRAGARRVVYASSSSLYGGRAELPTPETAPPHPKSPYAVSKLAAEQYCRVFSELYDLETVSLRYFNVYGPRQRPDSAYAAVIPLFIDALANHRRPPVHGDGHQSRDFTYIDDVVRANLLAATAPSCSGQAYNIAGGAPHSLLEILDIMGGLLGHVPSPDFQPPRPGDVRHSAADIAAARRDLGFAPLVDMREGLSRTVAWQTHLIGA